MILAPCSSMGQQKAQDSYPGPSAMLPGPEASEGPQKGPEASAEAMMAQAMAWAYESEAYHGLTGNWLPLPEALADFILALPRPSEDHLPRITSRGPGRPRRQPK